MDFDKESYRRQLAALREENECLRSAARTFGELAERLATELRRVRAQSEVSGTSSARAPIVRRLSGGATITSLRRVSRR